MTPEVTGSIRLNLVDGTRQPFPNETNVLLRILDGRKQQVASKWVKGPAIPIMGLPFHDSPDDWYTLIVHADGYKDAGVYPVRLEAGRLVDAYLMLTPSDGAFHFPPLASISKDNGIYQLIANGDAGFANRYHDTLENKPQQLGALLTIGSAIRDMPLDDRTSPLQYYWEVVWDLLAPDRFWAWVDARLADRIKALADLHSVAAELDSAHWHPGIPGRIKPATRSWKQTRFDVTNVQLTFHEDDRDIREVTPGGAKVPCVIVEPDIDYYKDVLSHGLLEVIPNLVTKGKTDPRNVYTLRWAATRQEGLEEFMPPCTIE